MKRRPVVISVICLAMFGCASTFFIHKTQRERDVDQCIYGAVVPNNISWRERANYIRHETVPACLRAKDYTDADLAPSSAQSAGGAR